MTSLLLWIALIVVFVLAAYIIILRVYIPYYKYSAELYKIPGPAPIPIIGNLLILNCGRTGAIPLLRRLHNKYGPIFRVHALGVAHVAIRDIKAVEKVLSSTRFITKSTDYNMLKPWLREGLLTSRETAMGTTINAQNGMEVEYVKAVQRVSQLIQERQLRLWLYNDFIFHCSSVGREQRKVLNILHGFTSKVIKQRRAEYEAFKNDPGIAETRVNKRRHLALLDMLIEISETEHKLTDLDIREEVDTFMFEGHDTTSVALCWTLHLLGNHPDIQERVVEELTNIFGDSDQPPTLEDLGKMKYLEQVIKEALRLFPSVPAFSRQLQEDTDIMGYNVPAGANVSIISLIYQRDPQLYPDPNKFDPDRFSPEAVQNRHPYAFLPFSAGPRGCIGQRFAVIEEKVILSTILRNFRVRSLDRTEDVTLLMELILRPEDPLRFKLSPRQTKGAMML